MSTLALEVFTSPWPAISNRVEMRVYAQSDDLAILDSVIKVDATIDNDWSFPGLPRVNLVFRIFEIDGGGGIIQQLGGNMNVIPPAFGGVQFKVHQLLEADVTGGYASGLNTFTMADWIGWDPIIDRIGSGPMKLGIDFSYDISTGTVTLLTGGDVFGPNEFLSVQFDPKVGEAPGSIPKADRISSCKRVTANYSISAGNDFGGVVIADPAGNYMELTLPDIATVVPLRTVIIEMRQNATQKCCKIKVTGANIIDWKRGNESALYICNSESIEIYRFVDPVGPTNYWRTVASSGNFLRVGDGVTNDSPAVNTFNTIKCIGQSANVQQYARFYNEYVAQLGGQLVNYDDWPTGNNKYKFSLANSANPANAGLFRVADRSNMFERITDEVRVAGDFKPFAIGTHRHLTVINQNVASSQFPTERGTVLTKLRSIIQNWSKTGGGAEGYFLDSKVDEPTVGRTSVAVDSNSNAFTVNENCPNHIAVNKYLYI